MRRFMTLMAVVALALAACGGDGGDEDVLGMGDRPLDRCELLTLEEVEPSVGSPATAEPSEGIDGEPNPVTCSYEGPNGLLLVQAYDGEEFFSRDSGEPLEGLGDEAFVTADGVSFLSDGWTVSILRLGMPSTAVDLEALARLMLERLP